ncbi:hypothetical protein Q9L58_006591 [Maublancomyces gigas]|uniref:Uncharacterized protein n=1 Tax=Discina gigas TaxID=1032678 RepID=A0ABR3GEX5_9PEZI
MKSRFLLQNSLLPLNSVQLGRLVLNAKNPQQDFLDPQSGQLQPESIVRPQENFEDILTLSRSSRLRSRLTALLAISYENRDVKSASLTATQATTYQLLNSGAWFENACAIPETRQWLKRAIDRSSPIYLVVGYHTLTNARATERITSRGTTDGGARISGSSVFGATTPATLSYLLTSKVDRNRRINYSHSRSFDAPGEQIYAIQYRKVEFKWYSSRRIDNTSLEQDNRWKVYWARGEGRRQRVTEEIGEQRWTEDYTSSGALSEGDTSVRHRIRDRKRVQLQVEAGLGRLAVGEGSRRGVQRRMEEGIERLVMREDGKRRGGGRENEDKDQLLKADLTDEIGFESNEKYISEDGEQEFLF